MHSGKKNLIRSKQLLHTPLPGLNVYIKLSITIMPLGGIQINLPARFYTISHSMAFRCFSEKYLTSSGMIKTFNSGFMLAEVSEILFHTVNPLSKD